MAKVSRAKKNARKKFFNPPSMKKARAQAQKAMDKVVKKIKTTVVYTPEEAKA